MVKEKVVGPAKHQRIIDDITTHARNYAEFCADHYAPVVAAVAVQHAQFLGQRTDGRQALASAQGTGGRRGLHLIVRERHGTGGEGVT